MNTRHHRCFGALLYAPFCLTLLQMGCAGLSAPTRGAEASAAAPHVDVAALRQRIVAAQLPLSQLHAEVRLVSFGPEGRLRGRADIYVQRPDHLRYTLMGPQGGPLIVLACDGDTLRGLDMPRRRFVIGAADAEQFDAWLSPVHLRLDARGWVRVLLGELEVPPHAVSAHNAPKDTVALSWTAAGNQRLWAAFGTGDARLVAARLCRGDDVDTRVFVDSRNAQGVPDRLRIEHTRPAADKVTSVELSLKDIDVQTPHKTDTYSLMPPDGFAIVSPKSGP